MNPSGRSTTAVCGALLLLTLGLLLGFPALAEAAELRTEVAARRVGVGQSFEVRITAVQKEGEPMPTSPLLPVHGKAEVRGPSVGTQKRVSMRNFSFDSESSVVARWTVTATEKGKLVVGPATFKVGGKTLRGETVIVEVVEQPLAPPSQRRMSGQDIFGDDPMDIFGDDPFGGFSRHPSSVPTVPEAPPEYQLERAPDPISFLHIIVDKKRALLGEPIRLTVLAYGSQGNFREVSPNEPSLPDFLSYSVVESSHEEPAFGTTIEGRQYLVRKLREFIIVPLKTGDLTIGAMSAILQGGRNAYPTRGSPLGMKVTGRDLKIHVEEPPREGRPDGYFPGDVGRYTIKADVTPRRVEQGEYAEIILQITGKGQIPSKILIPENKETTFEPPTLSGGPEIRDGELQGTRVLKFPVQINAAGTVDLGEVTLPFYDQRKKSYVTARVALGSIESIARKGATPQTHTSKSDTLGATTDDDNHEDEGLPLEPRSKALSFVPEAQLQVPPWSWWVLLGTPLLVLLGSVAAKVGKRARAAQKNKTRNEAPEYLRNASAAFDEKNDQEGLRVLERAVYASMDSATGRKTRGYLREHLARELVLAGLSPELCERCQNTLVLLEKVRFEGEGASPAELGAQCKKLVADLAREEKLLVKNRVRAARGEAP